MLRLSGFRDVFGVLVVLLVQYPRGTKEGTVGAVAGVHY